MWVDCRIWRCKRWYHMLKKDKGSVRKSPYYLLPPINYLTSTLSVPNINHCHRDKKVRRGKKVSENYAADKVEQEKLYEFFNKLSLQTMQMLEVIRTLEDSCGWPLVANRRRFVLALPILVKCLGSLSLVFLNIQCNVIS